MSTDPRYFWIDGDPVAFQTVGDGEPILTVLDAATNLDADWEQIHTAVELRRLSSICRLIRYDKRGFGLSQSARRTGLDAWVDDAVGVLDFLEVERACVWGHGLGSPVAIALAARHPERVDRLALSLAFARLTTARDQPFGLPMDTVQGLAELIRGRWGTGVMLDVLGVDHDDESRRVAARYERLSASPARAALLVGELAEIDLRHELAAVTAPTLVVHQTNPVLAREHSLQLATQIPGAELVDIELDDASWRERTESADAGPIFDHVVRFLTGRATVIPPDRRELVTALITDIVSSTKRAEALGDDRWHDLLIAHNDIVREELDRYSGREVRMTGDGVFAVFDSPARAVRCAMAMRDALTRIGVEIRAGVHTGEADRERDDFAGIAIHLTARISAEASAGQVLVSHAVPALVLGSSLRFTPLGDRSFKGIEGTWGVFEASS